MKRFYTLVVCLFVIGTTFSQCDVNNPYDRIISGYHSSIALKDNGIYTIWGSSMSQMGTDVLSPQEISSVNYNDITSTIYKAALGGGTSGGSVDQAFVLAEVGGLWAWGENGQVVKSSYTGGQNFQTTLVNIPGANSYSLPQGVTPVMVKSLFATYQTLVISTDSGFVYMLTQTSLALEANGGNAASAGTSTWQKVKINASTYLTGVTAVRGQVSTSSFNAFMALTATGNVYTWGNSTFLGNGTTVAARNYATQMTLPAEFSTSIPKMIGVTGGNASTITMRNTYYLLSNAGNLYAMGDNRERQIGDFTTTVRTSWVQVQKSATPSDYLTNVNTISVQEHNSGYPAVAAITNAGTLYTWGNNSRGMIGRTDDGTLSGTLNTVSFNPGIPVGFSVANDKAVIVEVGGHTLVYMKVGSSQFCYAGHQIQGSMGDGTTTNSSSGTLIYNCVSTPAIAICGSVPVPASTTTSTISATPSSIVANGVSTSTITVTLFNSSGTQLTTSGGVVVIYTSAGTIGTVTDNNNGTYTAILTSANTAGTATLTYSLNGATGTNTATVAFTGSASFDQGAIGYNQIICSGATPSPIVNVRLANGPSEVYTYTWEKSTTSISTGFTTIAGEIDSVYTPGALTQTTYFRRVAYDGSSYLNSNTVTITVNQATNSSTNYTACGASLPYVWNAQNYSTSGTYTYSTTNTNGCDSVATLVLTVASSDTISAASDANGAISPSGSVIVCNGDNQTFSFTPNTGYTIDSIIVDGTPQVVSNSYIFSNVTQNHSIYVSFKVLVAGSTNPQIAYQGSMSPDTVSICDGSIANLCPYVWGWSNYQWYLDGVAVAAPTGTASCINAPTAGNYTLAAQDGSGNWSAQSNPVYVNILTLPTPPVITANGNVTFCNGNSVVISSSQVSGNLWYKDGNLIPNANSQNYTALISGNYTASSLSANGCPSTSSNAIKVTVNTAVTPTITAGSPTSFQSGDSVILSSTNGATYQWYLNGNLIDGAVSQSFTATVAGSFTVVVTDANGCTSQVSSSISVSIILPVTTPQIAYNNTAAADTMILCLGTWAKLCPLNWGYSNYQWYKDGVAIAAPTGTRSCIDLDSSSTGSYTLAAQDGFGTWSVQSAPVYVIIDTTCAVSSGTGGGVESKSLGDVIAKRVYTSFVNSTPQTNGFSGGVQFYSSGAVVNGINDLKLGNLAPTKVMNTDAAYVSTPGDLVNFTNAAEVLAIDYVKSRNTKAALFSTKTLNNIYSHTKPICDRLRGAELLEVKNASIKGFSLVAYKIRQRTGEIEYAINLSAGTSASRNTISLQSHWFTDNYQSDDVLYNFQLWAVSYEMVQSMASDIIGKLQANGSLVAVGNSQIPKTYICKGGRKSKNILFTLYNNSKDSTGYFELREKANEPLSNSQIVVKQIPFTAKANSVSNFSIPVSDKYEHNIYVYLNNKLVDLVFFADGTWTLDYNGANTNINSFNVVNEPNVAVKENEYRLFRNVTVSGTTRDYITIYKTMMGGGIQQNLSDYKSLIFNANVTGAGSIKITLVKKSIANWNDQYSYTADLSGSNEYAVNLRDFKSAKSNSSINSDDIVSVSFAFINSRGVVTNMNINLSNVRFGKSELISSSLNVMSIKPNPAAGVFYTSFTSDIAQPLVLKVIELSTGRVIKTNFVNAIKGSNEVKVILESAKLNSGTFIVALEGDNVKFTPAKLILLNK